MTVALTTLWLPILASAILVFIASAVLWNAPRYRESEWHKLPDEEAARTALRGTPVGQYTLPHAASNDERKSEAWQSKYREGPAAMLVILPHGEMSMGRQLALWFVNCLVLSLLVAYVCGATLPAGTDYLKVFQVAATVGFLAYAGNAGMYSIWFGHSWSNTLKDYVDGLIYGLLTAGVFGWMWPAA